MPQKPHVSDYEPVMRTKVASDVPEADSEPWSGPNPRDSEVGSVGLGRSQERLRETASPAAEQDQQHRTAILKPGHAVSFAGLVVFTLILYFRPYELFTWLSWASSSAFVVAIFTLLSYVPTQLGLEGNLSARPREVNLVLLILLAATISMPLALKRTVAWNSLLDFAKVIVMFIVMVNVIRTEKRLKTMLLLALVTSCILSAAAVNDFRLGRFLVDLDLNRIRGFLGNLFDNPNDLALHLVTMFPLALGLLLGSRGALKKLFFAGSTVLIVAGVVATFSRGGFIGLVFSVAILAWRLMKRNKWMIAVSLPVALLLFVMLAPGGYKNRMATATDDSGLARLDELKRSLFLAAHHPVFGVGLNNYIYYSNFNHASHNAYTQVAAELGFPAMFAYILFLITPFKQLRRIANETSASRRTSGVFYLAAGLEASLFGYMAASFFLSVAYLWYIYYLVGYAICFRRLYEARLNGNAPVSGHSEALETRASLKTVARLESAPATQ